MGDRNYDPEQLNYNLFIFRAKKCIRDFLEAGNVDLDRLKEIFYNLNAESPTLNQQINQATTVEKIVQILEDHRIININDVSLLGRLAEELNLEDLQKAVDNYDWYHSQGIRRIALRLKAVLSNRSVQRLAGTAILVALYSERRELWEAIGETLPEAVRLTGVMEGSIAFVVESSSLSALRELWSSYKDGSLQENIRKALNDTKEVREVFDGEEFDVEVTIDEDEYRDACWNAVLVQMADRYKPTEESSSVGREHRHSLCDVDLPRVTMTELAWSDWINVREIYNESRIESNKRRKAENKVAELARELHILENERQPLVSERILQLQSELQRIQHEQGEMNRENLRLKNKLNEILSIQLDTLWESEPEDLLNVQHLTADLIKKAPDTLELAERLMSDLSKKIVSHPELHILVLMQMMQLTAKVLKSQPWYQLDDGSKMKLTSGFETMMTIVMTSVADRIVKHPDLSTDVLIQVMQENTKALQQLPWYHLDDGSKMKLTSGIEIMMTQVAEQLVNHSDLSTDVLIQVMQENTKTLQQLIPWYHIDEGSKMKLTSGIETMVTWVAEQLVNHSDLSTDVLIQVMQENTKTLQQLIPWYHIDEGSKMKLTSGIETMVTWVAEQLVNHSDLSTDVLIQVMQENTKALQQLPWQKLDDGSKMKLTSGIEIMMTSVADRLVNHSD
ncbi:uncharacterized protein LOC110234834, partial [Exaiptasia diaphana]|uniref:DED domain-containing protein n=1 Tax=Exaiptasia diaphana TaxID=2652724 RepID=A0A913WY45_EXADI